ncbi:MAG: serine/threonine-protein kinase [Anaerolineaceae bacterium]|nr:serine/threonine-protein kinase [Anaerolineaceae bacterium]
MTLGKGFLLNNRYRIQDVLGQGGMGAVYRALDENLNVTVAVKENSFFSEEYARQFQREAQTLASLRHPNLPRVFDYFVIDQEGQYLVMDYIEGDDLRQWMSRDEKITEAEAIQIGIAICNALIYLHSRVPAIVHRDIKPGNVKITPTGEVILVDFGLVKVMDNKEITTTAARAMTPGYSPPEQYGPDPTDHRSDIFSLGATLYAALAGYLAEDSLARATGKATLTRLWEYNPHLSDLTIEAIEKAINLRFEDRWQTAQDFKDALIAARRTLPLDQRSSPRLAMMTQTEPDRRTHPSQGIMALPPWANKVWKVLFGKKKKFDPIWAIFGFLLFLVLSVLIYVLLDPQGFQTLFHTPAQTTATYVAQATEATGLSTTPDPNATEFVISQTQNVTPTPTGGTSGVIAFTSDRSGLPQVWTIDVSTGQTTQLTDLMDGACQADWSPDGKQIVFTSPCTRKRDAYPGSSLYILNLENKQITALPPSLEGDFDPAWSPNGQWIAYTSLVNGQMQIMKINVDDFDTIIQLSDGTYDDSQPAWSEDGRQLAFIRLRSVGQVWLMDQDGENPIQFTLSGAIDDSNPVWYPEEDLIIFSQVLGLGSPSKQLFGMRLDDVGQAEEYIILPGAVSSYIPLMDHADIAPDGNWLAFDYWYSDLLSDIYIMTFPGSNLTQVTIDPGLDYDPAWKPIH